MDKEKVLKEIESKDNANDDKNYKTKEISVFSENCLRYNYTIIVAGIRQIFLIDCAKQIIIKKVKIEDNNFPCCTLTKFVDDSFITGSGFGEMIQYKLNENGDDLIFICKGSIYLDRVMTCV